MTVSLIDRVIAYHAAMERQDLERAAAMFSADAEYHSPSVGAIYGRHAMLAAFRSYFAEYPDQHAVDERLSYAGPDSVRSDWRLTATSKSTGKKIDRAGTAIMFFNHQGLIRRIEVTG
jgi:hypothetical protein